MRLCYIESFWLHSGAYRPGQAPTSKQPLLTLGATANRARTLVIFCGTHLQHLHATKTNAANAPVAAYCLRLGICVRINSIKGYRCSIFSFSIPMAASTSSSKGTNPFRRKKTLIAVMGATGSGKSSLIGALTGRYDIVGHALESG